MRALIFGTYDTTMHPRVGTIAEGLRASGFDVDECNAPLGLSTADRVKLLSQPWRLPALAGRLGARWATLARRAHKTPKPDVVVVGYLGHFDVHLARLLFRKTRIVLDQMVSASGTGKDRGLDGGPRKVLLRAIDAAALSAADVVVVDTQEHLDTLPDRFKERAVVVPVGAPAAWFADASADKTGPLRVVFYGLYTPLQGAPVIGEALGLLADQDIEVTMIGTGQDYAVTRAAAAANPNIHWLDWVASTDLPELVAGHDVCLGIFGTGDKALRVVPNKVFQGAAAGCAVVTSDTPPQRRALGANAMLVPPGDAKALASALAELAADPEALARARAAARELADRSFAPQAVVEPLITYLYETGRSGHPAVPASR